MSPRWPQSLFARTALLIASTLAAFSLIAWAATVWTTVIPAAEATAHVLAERTDAAVAAYRSGAPLPDGVTVARTLAARESRLLPGFAFSFYLINVRRQLQADLNGSEVFVARTAIPSEIWVRTPQIPDRWLVLRWQLARPETPMALFVVIAIGALLVLGGATIFARRLTAPLADLVLATQRVAEGERITVDPVSGPVEVRSLAMAFQSMSHRLAELHEQRELMLAGLSHDLRSPLARVRVAVELLDTRDLELARQMTVDVEEIDRMIGQFLHFVRAGYREAPVRACPDEVIRETLSRHAPQPGLRMQLHATETRLLAVDALRHIVINLVQNAFEYGKTPVTVHTCLAPGELRLSIEDSGPGLSEQEWREALLPFRRVRAIPGTGHTGLGLAMVDRLVHACRGTLAARRIEGGFTVDITLATTGLNVTDAHSTHDMPIT